MKTSPFQNVELAPRDPILGLTEAFVADSRSSKVNLGVGVYCDDNGKIPLLRAVREAERARVEAGVPRGYLPIEGLAAYDAAVQKLLFGVDSPLIAAGRLVTAQALGGTGALKIGADFLKRINPGAQVMISDPSWENHRALFEGAGFVVESYPYYDYAIWPNYLVWRHRFSEWQNSGSDRPYHYLGSARFFARFGHACGQAMVKLNK